MCQFLSGLVTISRHPKVLCLDLKSHDKSIAALGIKEETYREFEWTREDDGDSLDVRCLPDEDQNDFKAAILAKFPTRRDCLIECIRQMAASERNLDYDLRGCDLTGITLPTTVGGYLDLRGCDLTGITLPTTVGGVK
jgi:hypothetical protein